MQTIYAPTIKGGEALVEDRSSGKWTCGWGGQNREGPLSSWPDSDTSDRSEDSGATTEIPWTDFLEFCLVKGRGSAVKEHVHLGPCDLRYQLSSVPELTQITQIGSCWSMAFLILHTAAQKDKSDAEVQKR